MTTYYLIENPEHGNRIVELVQCKTMKFSPPMPSDFAIIRMHMTRPKGYAEWAEHNPDFVVIIDSKEWIWTTVVQTNKNNDLPSGYCFMS